MCMDGVHQDPGAFSLWYPLKSRRAGVSENHLLPCAWPLLKEPAGG